MGDPLVEIYDRSFSGAKPKERTATTPLPSSTVKNLSERIQSSGSHPGLPPYVDQVSGRAGRPVGWSDPIGEVAGWTAPDVHKTMKLSPTLEALDRSLVSALWSAERAEYDLLFKLYEELVAKEYDRIRAFTGGHSHIFKQFEDFGKRKGVGGGLAYYRRLRPIWYRAMIREPVKFMEQVIEFPSLKLAGVPVTQGVHPEFATILQRVDKNIAEVLRQLKANAPTPNPSGRIMKVVGCFRPDPVEDRISNHMIGAAVDIDSNRNPYLGGARIRPLDRMLAFVADDEAQANPNVTPERLKIEASWLSELPKLQSFSDVEKARRAYEKTVKISEKTKAFLTEFLDQWETFRKDRKTPADQRTQRAFALVEDLLKVFPSKNPKKAPLDGLKTIRDQGLISIPAEVFIALDADPDLEWGIWTSLADPILDVMHFQVTPRTRERIIGTGYP